jgi:alpha-1,3-glucan synthase
MDPHLFACLKMLAATSFQITLLSGHNRQDDLQLYILGAVFLVASIAWYTLSRLRPSVYSLSAPWIFFSLAFLLVGIPSVAPHMLRAHSRIFTRLATWSYAIASAAAFLFFSLNFGEEAVRRKFIVFLPS